MSANLIDGKRVSKRLLEKVKKTVAELSDRSGELPCIRVFRVGDDPASKVYVRRKVQTAEDCGLVSREALVPNAISEEGLLKDILLAVDDDECHGILVQLPLPERFDPAKVINSIDPTKDVDGLHVANVGALWSDQDGFLPCTPLGCVMLLRDTLGNLTGMNAVVLGRSNIVGKPMANLLLAENCTVTVAHSRTRDLPSVCRNADILIAAVGRPQFVRGDWIRPGATVIDVGINRIQAPERGEGRTRLVGDVNFDEAVAVAGAITPVPGGVGPMTIACLMANTVTAFCRIKGLEVPEGLGI